VLNQNGKYYPDLVADGVIGNKTIAAVNAHPNPNNIFKALNCLQGAYYIQLAEQKESQEAFANGWFDKRVA
jgi:lysozyme family protein